MSSINSPFWLQDLQFKCRYKLKDSAYVFLSIDFIGVYFLFEFGTAFAK